MNSRPIKPRDIDFKKVTFSAPRAMGNTGAKMLFINYDGMPFSVQLPELMVGWDIMFYGDERNPGSGKYQVSLKFANMSDKKQSEMHSFLENLDKTLIKACQENSASWIKKPKIDESGAKLLYTPLIRHSLDKETGEPNGKYPDEFKIKLVKRDNQHLFKLFDENTKEVTLDGADIPLEDLIKKGSKLRGVIRCNGVWFASGKFGCTWKGEQIKVETPKQVAEYAFEDTDDDDECDKKKDNQISDSEEESSEEETDSESGL